MFIVLISEPYSQCRFWLSFPIYEYIAAPYASPQSVEAFPFRPHMFCSSYLIEMVDIVVQMLYL